MIPISDWTLNERKAFIGKKAKVGTIVRVKAEKVIHVLITEVSEKYLKGYKIILGTSGYNPEAGDIILEKNKDVVYQNLTYKAKVTLTKELMTDLRRQDFIYSCGGLVVGRICNDELFQQILQRNKVKEVEKDAEEKKAEEKVPEIRHDADDCINPIKEEVKEFSGETEKPTPTVLANEENEQNELLPAFEEYIESKSSEEVIASMNLHGTILAEAIGICMKNKSFNMKKLLPILQKNNEEKRMTQTAIKGQMNSEFAKWCETKTFSLSEESVSYLLKLIVKKCK